MRRSRLTKRGVLCVCCVPKVAPPGRRVQPNRPKSRITEKGGSRRSRPFLILENAVTSLLLCGQRGFFSSSALLLIFLHELVNAASRIDQLLLAGEEGMAARADFDADVALIGGAGAEGM